MWGGGNCGISRPHPFNRESRLCLQMLCLSSVHPISTLADGQMDGPKINATVRGKFGNLNFMDKDWGIRSVGENELPASCKQEGGQRAGQRKGSPVLPSVLLAKIINAQPRWRTERI